MDAFQSATIRTAYSMIALLGYDVSVAMNGEDKQQILVAINIGLIGHCVLKSF